jgi:hypothetical protein
VPSGRVAVLPRTPGRPRSCPMTSVLAALVEGGRRNAFYFYVFSLQNESATFSCGRVVACGDNYTWYTWRELFPHWLVLWPVNTVLHFNASLSLLT